MPAGRPPVPPEISRLKGNPRKKRVRGKRPPPAAAAAELEVLPPDKSPALAVVYPEFLTHDRERAIFRLIVEEFLPRNLVRITDFNAVGRYATYMHMWIMAKEQLAESGGHNWYKVKSKHLPEGMLRRHPAFQDMLDLGHELRQAEPQLALTPLARNAIMQRFMRGAGDPNLFAPEDDPARRDEPPSAPVPINALGALRRSATPLDQLTAISDAKN